MTTRIAIVNESSILSDAQVAAATKALNHQLGYDYNPHWGTNAHCYFYPNGTTVPGSAWVLAILDDTDQAGALGYHDVTATGLPLGKVFAKTDQHYGLSWTVTASHEILEMVGDPECVRAAQTAATTFVAWEMCDPCEADQYGYTINGVQVSDFVLPAYFSPGEPGPYDFCGHIPAPLTLLPGGYQAVWTPKTGWTQKTADTIPGVTSRVATAHRIAHRPKGADNE